MDSDAAKTFQTCFTVRTCELDGFRHVNNAVFVQYLEAARGDFVRTVGLAYANFHEWEAYPVVVRVEVDYLASAVADEEIAIELRLTEWRRAGFTIHYEVRRSDGGCIARAMTRHAFVNGAGTSVRVPQAFRTAVDDWTTRQR